MQFLKVVLHLEKGWVESTEFPYIPLSSPPKFSPIFIFCVDMVYLL